MTRVLVIGGGISGLAAAHRLRELSPGVEVKLLEASPRLGGWIRTDDLDGYTVERGPESFITTKPSALALVERMGLTGELMGTNSASRGAFIARGDELHPIPAGFSVVAPGRLLPLMRSPLLSLRGKARALVEPWLPGGSQGRDESLASFVRRRYGDEVLSRLAQPLAGGIYGADPEDLSLRSTMPRFLELEKSHGSVTRGLRAREAQDGASSGARYGLFLSFKKGMQTLVDALERRLPGVVEREVQVTHVSRHENGRWSIQTSTGQRESDAIILATPAHTSSRLIESVEPEIASGLGAIEYGSSAAVTFGWDRSQIEHALNGFGFLVPAIEGSPVMASTWSSIKWPGRAPAGKVLIRIYLGGFHIPDIDGWTDAALTTSSRHALSRWLGARGEPDWVRVDRYRRSMPRYLVGHEARMKKVFQGLAEVPRLELSGNAYQGVGIPDAIRTGEEAAARALNDLGVLLPRRETAGG